MDLIRNLIRNFTADFRSVPVKDAFEKLTKLSEELENLENPTVKELQLSESVNNALEKLSSLNNTLSDIKILSNKTLSGNVLSDLYDKSKEDKSYLIE